MELEAGRDMLKIWGRKNSANVQKVMWAVGELGLPYERVDIAGPFGKNREPSYLALNPNGLVPTLEEDGFVLWELNAIVRYLAVTHSAGKLAPADPKQRALAGQWMDWQLSVLGPVIFDLFWGLVRAPPEQRNAAAIEASRIKTGEALTILNAQLGKTAYVAGDTFSMGDIPVAIFAYRYLTLAKERPPLPHVERWHAAIAERPAFRQHILDVPLT